MASFPAFLQRLFGRYAARLLRRSFAGVRLLDPSLVGGPSELPRGPVIVAMNHASWWDPLVGLLLSQRLDPLFGGRAHSAPMEAAALERYGFFRWMGFYPVDRGSRAGLARFVGESQAILDRPGSVLWITPQGRFADPRERPLRIESGVGHLARRVRGGSVLPVAVEYCFWTERRPEVLIAVGRPVPIEDGSTATAAAWTARVRAEMERTQDLLAGFAQDGDPDSFVPLLGGQQGVGGVYDLVGQIRARLAGRRFVAAHRALVPTEANLPPAARR